MQPDDNHRTRQHTGGQEPRRCSAPGKLRTSKEMCGPSSKIGASSSKFQRSGVPNSLDSGTQSWYTRLVRAVSKPLELLDFYGQADSPPLSARSSSKPIVFDEFLETATSYTPHYTPHY
jgi:hypothetical protein